MIYTKKNVISFYSLHALALLGVVVRSVDTCDGVRWALSMGACGPLCVRLVFSFITFHVALLGSLGSDQSPVMIFDSSFSRWTLCLVCLKGFLRCTAYIVIYSWIFCTGTFDFWVFFGPMGCLVVDC